MVSEMRRSCIYDRAFALLFGKWNDINFICIGVQWDAVENKSTVIVYGGGAIVAVWLSSVVVGAINSVPW